MLALAVLVGFAAPTCDGSATARAAATPITIANRLPMSSFASVGARTLDREPPLVYASLHPIRGSRSMFARRSHRSEPGGAPRSSCDIAPAVSRGTLRFPFKAEWLEP